MSDDEVQDTIDYIEHLHDVDQAPAVWRAYLPIERPDMMEWKTEDERDRWIIELS